MEELPKFNKHTIKSNYQYFHTAVVLILSIVLFSGCGDSSPPVPDFSTLNIDQLVSRFQSGNSVEKLEVCRCLAVSGDKESVKELMAALSDEDKMIKVAAITGLGSVGSELAVDSLLPFLTEDDAMLSFNAMKALVEIGGKNALTGILKSTSKNKTLASEFKELVQSNTDSIMSSDLLKIASDFSSLKTLRMESLYYLKFVDFDKEQIVSLFKTSKIEKDRKISSLMIEVAKMQKEAFVLREKRQKINESLALPKDKILSDTSKSIDKVKAAKDARQAQATKAAEASRKAQADKVARQAQAAKVARQAQAAKAAEAARRAQAAKAAEAARRAQAAKAAEAARRAQAEKAAHQAKAVSKSYNWPNPQSVFSSFISKARKGMASGGNRNMGVKHYNSGVEESQAGNFREAIDSYTKAVQAYPEFFEAHFALAMLYDRNRDLQKGLFHLSQCLLLEPERDDVYYRVACNFEAQKNDRSAWAFFVMASKKNSSNGEYLFRAGLIAFRKKDLEKAVVFMKKASAISPRRPDVLENLAALYLNLGQKQKAREYALSARNYGANVDALLSAIETSR